MCLIKAVTRECLDLIGCSLYNLMFVSVILDICREIMFHGRRFKPIHLLFHQHRVLLTHCLTKDVCTSKRTTSHLADTCHNLFLVDQNTIGFLKITLFLTEQINNWFFASLTINQMLYHRLAFNYCIKRSWSIQCNTSGNPHEILNLKTTQFLNC